MKILVLGATGRTGRLIAQYLVGAGHAVTALGRRDPQIDGLMFQKGDVMNSNTLRAAAEGAEAVISALASGKDAPVCSQVAKTLAPLAGLRVITIAGAGVDAAGDAKGAMDHVAGWLMRRVVPHMILDRQAELAVLEASALRWTMLRPPRLTNGAATGQASVTFDKPATTAISRADLARVAVGALDQDAWIGRAPFVAG